jgi:DNA repair protein RadC
MTPDATALQKKEKYELPRLKLMLVTEPSANPQLKCPVPNLYTLRSPNDIAEFFEPIRDLPEEHFVALHLNANHEIIGLHEVSHGTLSASLVHPREVFKAALLANSHAIVICHNHPSGSPLTPSVEDLDTTIQLIAAGRLLGLIVLDHVILSPVHNYFSIREHYPVLWEEEKKK